MKSENRKTILLVEDEHLIALTEKLTLEKFGYDVIIAGTGETAIEIMSHGRLIDLILMDINLGAGIPGTEAAKQILKNYAIPIVFLTSLSESGIEEVRGITRYGYVSKNSESFVLQASIEMAFEMFEAHKRLQAELKQCRQSEEAKKEVEQNYKTLVESGQALIWLSGRDKLCYYFNNVWLEFTGRTIEQEIGNGWTEGVHPDDLQYCLDIYLSAFDRREKFSMEYRLRKHDGQYCWILDDGCPRYNSSGEFLGYIGHCLDITENKRREAEIARTLSLLRSTMESTADGIMVADGKGKMVRSNIKFREMWGITESIIESKDENAAINFVLDQLKEPEIFLNIVHNLYATPEKISFDEVELKDGRMVERYSQPQWIGDKVVGRVWSFRDITERRKAEDKIKNLLIEKETILKEVHHRIKNNMSTIFNLLDLQAGELKEPSAIRSLEDAGSRVLSMLVLYEKLYKSTGFQEISVVDYIPELVDQIISNFPDNKLVKIDKKIDDFILDATRLQPLGIIINELLTNIMKYAFTGKDDRWIRICATLNDNLVSFVIEDNGNGMPELIDFENSTGFGLMLVRMLTEQLRGTVRIERGNGTRIVLEFEK